VKVQKLNIMIMRNILTLFLFLPIFANGQQWTSLFNGNNLNGWNQVGGQAKYRVENKAIVGTTVSKTPNSFLRTNEVYGDFILELELLVDNMNSGVQFRSLSIPDYQNGRVHGYQMEIDPSPRAWSGGIYDEARRDWLYIPEINEKAKTAFKIGQWNKYRIEAIGNTIRTWINGVPISHLIDDMTPKGFIALQVHSIPDTDKPGKEIKWKNIRIATKNLNPSPLDDCPVINLVDNFISPQEVKLGFEQLFPQDDFSKWRSVHSKSKPNGRWSISNGIVSVSKSDGSETGNDIVTESKYGAFELVFDFKLTQGANSGIKYFVDEKYDSGGKSGIGLEYQVLDDDAHPDAKMGVVGNRTLASLYDLIPSEKLNNRFKRKVGDWNYGRIVVRPDNIVQHWLNGFKVVEYQRNSNIYKALVARSKYVNYEGFGSAQEGHILLQDHGDLVSFKNLKIRKL
jgi:hypothetical protein